MCSKLCFWVEDFTFSTNTAPGMNRLSNIDIISMEVNEEEYLYVLPNNGLNNNFNKIPFLWSEFDQWAYEG